MLKLLKFITKRTSRKSSRYFLTILGIKRFLFISAIQGYHSANYLNVSKRWGDNKIIFIENYFKSLGYKVRRSFCDDKLEIIWFE